MNRMVETNILGVEFWSVNTDSQALAKSLAPGKLQLGPALTSGLGTGARPDLGRQSAEESLKQLTEHLKGRALCFITAGMGGGTGTGAAPVIAKPRESSAPSHEWPPMSAQRASLRTAHAPAIIWKSDSSTLPSRNRTVPLSIRWPRPS